MSPLVFMRKLYRRLVLDPEYTEAAAELDRQLKRLESDQETELEEAIHAGYMPRTEETQW